MTHAITIIHVANGETLTKTVQKTGEKEIVIALNVPASTTDQLIAFVLDVSQSISVYLLSSAAITLETNSSGSPAKTIALTADTPVVWTNAQPASENPFGTTDVTAIYATTGAIGVGGADLKIKILVDPTV